MTARELSVLRLYLPHECDQAGVPLDWERCRACDGTGGEETFVGWASFPERSCEACDGYGSLRAAALGACREEKRNTLTPSEAMDVAPQDGLAGLRWGPDDHIVNCDDEHVYLKQMYDDAGKRRGITDCCYVGRPCERHGALNPTRCEDCGHPMSDGTWDPPQEPHRVAQGLRRALESLREGREPRSMAVDLYGDQPRRVPVHYSLCDLQCTHPGPARYRWDDVDPWFDEPKSVSLKGIVHLEPSSIIEASWRPVDVRTLSWPHDLRPEMLAVLCLRCWAARSGS